MNKLFTKIATAFAGMAMAVGVGVAVSSNNEVRRTDAVNYAWQKMTSTSEFVNGATLLITQGSYYLNVSATSTSQTPRLAALTLSSGLPTLTANNTECFVVSGSGSSIKLCKATDTTKWLITGSSNNAAKINTGTTGNYWTISSAGSEKFYLQSNSSNRYLSRYGTTDFRSYTNSNTNADLTIYKLVESQQTQTITVDPASKEAYTDETISLTTNATSASWALSNNTCGASLSAASGKTVTVSATSAGSVRVTATASGYTSPYVDLTFNEKPTSPFITPEKASASGYTGQNETISFTYGNLTGSLGVTSSNTSVVTVGSPSYDAGEGTVQFNYVGAGSTTVKFKEGSTELASVNVTVTTSSVIITGLPASKSISNGGTFNLGSLITVTATGSYSSDVTWESDDDSIVSVTSAGIITGESVGTTNVTVTSDDYPTATMTCSVTVANMISAVFASGTSDGTSAESDSDNLINNYGYTVDSNIYFPSLTAVYPKAGNAIKLGGSSTKGSMTIGLVDGKVSSKNAYITKITVNAMAYGTDSTSITINGTSKTLTSSFADYDVDVTGTSTTSITIEASATSKQRFRIQYINVFYANPVELSSVTTSGQNTLFTAGNKWSYGGTLTAHYSDSSSATKTPTSFKFGASGIDPTSAGTTITTNTTLDHDTHNGKYIYVVYTEDGITKYCSYQITVNYAAVTSVTLNENTAEIGLGELFNYNLVTVTVSPSNANPAVTWSVLSNTVGDDYTFNSSGLKAGNTEGAVTLKCASDADSSKYATLVVTVTGDPTAEFVKESTSGYAGKTEEIAFTYGNIDDESKITVASSNPSIVSVANDLVADEGEGLVTINFVAAGSANVTISYNGGATLDTLPVTVSADSVVALNWTASNIKVYSGAVLPVAIEDTWMVNYEMASGDTDFITYSDGDYNVKLGGSTITLPHTWVVEDDGKTLCVEYGGVQTSTVSVDVTQSLQAVMADVMGEPTTKTWNAAAGDLGASMGSTAGVTDSGSLTFDDDSTMSYTRTLEYLASGKSDYVAFSSPYIQFGSSNALETLELSVTNSNVVTEVQIYCWAKNGATDVTVKVGGNVFDESKSAPSAAGSLTFSGSASGNIVITMEKASKTAGCAQYIASVAITTIESSGEKTNIANVAGHEAAQKAVVAFAKAMNAAFDNTENCTDGVATAWTTATNAYASNITNNASLSADEKAYANNLIKYATAQYTDDTDEDFSYCLERAMKTYEVCIQKHGQTGFIGVRTVTPSIVVNPVAVLSDAGSTVTIIVVTSMIALSAVGGYFFLRKRKENI